jgi:hypothetical protein
MSKITLTIEIDDSRLAELGPVLEALTGLDLPRDPAPQAAGPCHCRHCGHKLAAGNPGPFCSKTCYGRYHYNIALTRGSKRPAAKQARLCAYGPCGRTFTARRSDAIYCSAGCRKKAHYRAQFPASAASD